MACNSVATSKATISQVYLAQAELTGMLSKLLNIPNEEIGFYEMDRGGVAKTHNGSKRTLTYDYSHARVYSDRSGISTITIAQFVDNDEITLKLVITGDSQAAVDAYQTSIEAEYEKLQVIANQTSVLKRLATLGKLSNIQQKSSGVTARLEITL